MARWINVMQPLASLKASQVVRTKVFIPVSTFLVPQRARSVYIPHPCPQVVHMGGTSDLHASIQGLVNSIQAEIDALVQQKADLNRHKRNLWRRLRALQSGTNPSGYDRTRRSKRQRSTDGRAIARKSRYLYSELWRACRIAIMETGANPTAEQIYLQIVRRGSFNFDDLQENPISAISRTLDFTSGL